MSSPGRPRARPIRLRAWAFPILCAIAAFDCDGVVWTLPEGGMAPGAEGPSAFDGSHGDAMPPPFDTSVLTPGDPWPSCVNGQCSEPWLHCNGTTNLCVPCIHNTNSTQCPTDAPYSWLTVCDLLAGDLFENQCVECVDQHDCGDNEVCEEYQCISVCQSGLSCPKTSANYCDRTRSICVACLSTSDCSMGQSCNTYTGRCGECASDADCPAFRPRCDLRDNECVECITSADCSGAVCDPQTQTCSNSKM